MLNELCIRELDEELLMIKLLEELNVFKTRIQIQLTFLQRVAAGWLRARFPSLVNLKC